MATQANQTVTTGCTVLLKVGGQTVGRAQGLDARRSFGTEGVYEIGSIMPQEHVNNRYEGTLTLERYLIKNAELNKKVPELAALGEDILTHDVIDIVVVDKASGKAIRVYHGCTAVDYSENFRVGAISGENSTWQYMECWGDESFGLPARSQAARNAANAGGSGVRIDSQTSAMLNMGKDYGL